MKTLIFSALLSVGSLSAFASTGVTPKDNSAATEKSTVKKEAKSMDCTVNMDCGNGTSVSATSSNCQRAGAAAGAGCDAQTT